MSITEGDPHFRALSDFIVVKAMSDWMHFADCVPIEIAINLPAAVKGAGSFYVGCLAARTGCEQPHQNRRSSFLGSDEDRVSR